MSGQLDPALPLHAMGPTPRSSARGAGARYAGNRPSARAAPGSRSLLMPLSRRRRPMDVVRRSSSRACRPGARRPVAARGGSRGDGRDVSRGRRDHRRDRARGEARVIGSARSGSGSRRCSLRGGAVGAGARRGRHRRCHDRGCRRRASTRAHQWVGIAGSRIVAIGSVRGRDGGARGAAHRRPRPVPHPGTLGHAHAFALVGGGGAHLPSGVRRRTASPASGTWAVSCRSCSRCAIRSAAATALVPRVYGAGVILDGPQPVDPSISVAGRRLGARRGGDGLARRRRRRFLQGVHAAAARRVLRGDRGGAAASASRSPGTSRTR